MRGRASDFSRSSTTTAPTPAAAQGEHFPERQRDAACSSPLPALPFVHRPAWDGVLPLVPSFAGDDECAHRLEELLLPVAALAGESITQPEPRLIETMVSAKTGASTWAGMPRPAAYSFTISWSARSGIRRSRSRRAATS